MQQPVPPMMVVVTALVQSLLPQPLLAGIPRPGLPPNMPPPWGQPTYEMHASTIAMPCKCEPACTSCAANP